MEYSIERYMLKVGIRSADYGYSEEVLFEHLDYFKKCYADNLSEYKALEWLSFEIMQYSYWDVYYISCEGNERHGVARTTTDFDAYEVQSRIQLGGVGDDVAEIISIDPGHSFGHDSFSWDFSNVNK